MNEWTNGGKLKVLKSDNEWEIEVTTDELTRINLYGLRCPGEVIHLLTSRNGTMVSISKTCV